MVWRTIGAATLLSMVAQAPPPGPELMQVRIARPGQMPALTKSAPAAIPVSILPPGRVEIEVQFVVGRSGTVVYARVVDPATERAALEAALIEGVRGWTFSAPRDVSGNSLATLNAATFTIEPDAAVDVPARANAKLGFVLREPLAETGAAGQEQTVYKLPTPGVRDPIVIISVEPEYTGPAMQRKVMGTVEVEVVILRDGSIGAQRVTKSLDPGLDREALIAARHWLFRPAIFEGSAVASRATIILSFRLH
jgi:TonB family protein